MFSMNNDAHDIYNSRPGLVYQWGFWALCTGALALMLVFLQIAGPMLEPQQSVGSQIGEIAGDMKRAAWRSFFGLEPDAEQLVRPSLWHYFAVVAPMFGIVAIALSVISKVKKEHRQFPIYATGFGVTAILFQYLWWLALLVAGIMLIISVIQNLGDFFSL